MRILIAVAACAICLFHFSPAAAAGERVTPVVKAVQKVQDAVVNIRTETVVRRAGPFNDPFFDEFMGYGGTYRSQSLGTGVIIRGDGIVVTNYHVIDSSTDITVILPDNRQYKAAIVGGDSLLDIAILKVAGASGSLPYLPLGTANDLLPGETVIAIGNPYGLNSSVTTGVVSNIRRILKVDNDFAVFIQTDALINPGNSGGPLINLDGEVIGINSAIYRDAQGIGFAIPIDAVRRVLPDIMQYQKIRRGYLGFSLKTPSDTSAGGLQVSEVMHGGEAERLGVRNGDYLISLDDLPLSGTVSVNYILRTFPPGESVRAVFMRNGKEIRLTLRLSEYPRNYGIMVLRDKYGLVVAEQNNVIVVRSSRYPQYIREGDILVAVNGRELSGMQALDTLMSEGTFEDLNLTVSRNRRVFEILLKP